TAVEAVLSYSQGSFTPMQKSLRGIVEPCDRRHLKVRLRAASHACNDVDVLRNTHGTQHPLRIRTGLHEDFAQCRNKHGLSHPTHDGLVPDAERQHVETGDSSVLPPVKWRLAVQKRTDLPNVYCEQFAEVAGCEHAAQGGVGSQSDRGRHKLCHLCRML